MQHQDWETKIVRGNVQKTIKPSNKVITTPGNKQDTVLTVKKVYDQENPNADPEIRPVLIDKDFAMKMTQARVIKKMSQVQLARACMIDVKIINDYERGGCARNGSYITKIKKILGNF